MKKSNKMFPVLLSAFLSVLFMGTVGFLVKKSGKPPVTYPMATPFVSTIDAKAVATGSVEPREKIFMKSRVSGVVGKIYVQPGQQVEKGQLIARISLTPNVIELNNADNTLQKAHISLDQAKTELARNEKLYQEKVISDKEYQTYVVAYREAKANLTAAENNLTLVKEGTAKNMTNASNEVRSTIRGMILDVPVKEGSFVIESNTFNEGTTIAAIADMQDMIFLGKVDEAEVEQLRAGMDLSLTIGAKEAKAYRAKLESISPQGVEEEGVTRFELKAAVLLDPTAFVRAGYSANADIILAHRERVLAVQESWLQFDGEKPYVEVEVRPQVFEKKYLKLGVSDEMNVEVLAGVRPHDKIRIPEAKVAQ